MADLTELKYIAKPPVNGIINDVGIYNPYWIEKNRPDLVSRFGVQAFTDQYGSKYLPNQSQVSSEQQQNQPSIQPKSKTPENPGEKDLPGYAINDPQYGGIFIGEYEAAKRIRQVEVHSQSGAHLKLFKDGGFELHGQPCDTADNINSNAVHGLNIKGNNLRLDAGNGTLTLAARIIRFESTASDETLVIRSSNNIAIEANDTVRISAANIILGARNKLLLGSKGPTYIKGNGGVTIIEPRSSLIPKNLGELVEKLFTAAVFGEI